MNKAMFWRKISLFFACLIVALPLYPDALSSLADTWQSVPEEYKKYSIVNGAALIKTDWLNNFHYFGNLYPVISTDTQGRTIMGYNPPKANIDHVINLAYVLFHRVGTSTNPADFGITEFTNTSDPKKIALCGAQIVASLDKLSKIKYGSLNAYHEFKNQIQNAQDDPELIKNSVIAKGLKELQANLTMGTKLAHTAQMLFKSTKSKFGPSIKEIKEDLWKSASDYLEANELFNNTFLTPAQTLLKLSANKYLKISPDNFVDLMMYAIQECNGTYYSIDLVYYIWEAFLYQAIEKACKGDIPAMREAFQIYYKELNKLLGLNIELPTEISLPTQISVPLAANHVQRLLQDPHNAIAHLDDLLFYAINCSPLPAPKPYANPIYKPFGDDGPIFTRPDCMEYTIANPILTWSYNSVSGKYEIETLERRLGISLTDRAKENIKILLEDPDDHNDWMQLVSNIPYIPYLRAATKEGKYINGGMHPRFMRLNSEDLQTNTDLKQKYEAAGYTIIADDQVAFELIPSVYTIITLFNYILDLDLFSENGGLAQEGLRVDFIDHYLPQLAKALRMKAHYSLSPLQEPIQETKETIDEIDSKGERKIYTQLTAQLSEAGNKNISYNLVTYYGHGEYYFDIEGLTENLQFNAQVWQNFIRQPHPALFLVSLILNKLFTREAFFSLFSNFSTLFAFPINNPDYAFALVKIISASFLRAPNLPSQFRQKTELLLFNFIKYQPDLNRTIQLAKEVLPYFTNPTLLNNFGKWGIEALQKNISALTTGDSNPNEISISINLLGNLATHNKIDYATRQSISDQILTGLANVTDQSLASGLSDLLITTIPDQDKHAYKNKIVKIIENQPQQSWETILPKAIQAGILNEDEAVKELTQLYNKNKLTLSPRLFEIFNTLLNSPERTQISDENRTQLKTMLLHLAKEIEQLPQTFPLGSFLLESLRNNLLNKEEVADIINLWNNKRNLPFSAQLLNVFNILLLKEPTIPQPISDDKRLLLLSALSNISKDIPSSMIDSVLSAPYFTELDPEAQKILKSQEEKETEMARVWLQRMTGY